MHFFVLEAVWEPNYAFLQGCLGAKIMPFCCIRGCLALNSAFCCIKGCLGAKFSIFAVLGAVWEPFKGLFGVVPP